MNLHSAAIAVGLTCALGGCSAASQTRTHTAAHVAGAQCTSLTDRDRQVAELHAPGQVTHVAPFHRQEFVARAIQPRYLAGAKLYVPAQQGFSEPYLERVLSCHAAAKTTVHPNDPLRADNIRSIDVTTAGSQFVVTIQGSDRRAGKEIWQRAKALHEPSSEVEVRQLSARGDEATKL